MARRRTQTRQLAEELRSLDFTNPDAARWHVVETVRRWADGHGGGWYDLGVRQGIAAPVRWVVTGEQGYLARVNHALARNREDPVPWGVGDPERPTAEWLRTFVEGNALWGDWARYRETPFYQHVLRRIGIDDHLRLLVYRGERFIGWIGAVRGRSEPHFTAGERRALQPLVEPVAAALVAADAAERDMRAQLGDAELVVRPDGSPEYASSAVRHWLGDRTMRPRLERLTRIIDQGFGERELWLDGTRVRWTRLAGVGGALRYLLHLDTVPAVYRHPDSCLTPAQREVGQLASAGLSSTEVARQLGVSAETVRTHLRQVYRRLGISTRTELTRVMGS